MYPCHVFVDAVSKSAAKIRKICNCHNFCVFYFCIFPVDSILFAKAEAYITFRANY